MLALNKENFFVYGRICIYLIGIFQKLACIKFSAFIKQVSGGNVCIGFCIG